MKNDRKNLIFSLFPPLLVLCSLLLSNCPNPWAGGNNETGTITINLGGDGTARSTGFGGVALNDITHRVTLYDTAIAGHDGIVLPVSGGIATANVEPGNYRIEVDAFLRGWDYARATYPPTAPSFEVKAGEPYEANISMQRMNSAIVLNIHKDEFLKGRAFPPVLVGGTAPTWQITVSNYTGVGSSGYTANITETLSSSAFSATRSVANPVSADSDITFTITASTATLGRHNATMNITGPSGPVSINLSSLVATSIITMPGELTTNLSASIPTQYHVLGNNINLGGTAWTPIAPSNFNGTFDGNGFTISGLYINSTIDYQGLFNTIGADGKVINLGVKGSVTGRQHVGGIAGVLLGVVENCYSEVEVSGRDLVGGIVGRTNASSASVRNCYAAGNITGLNVGGSTPFAVGGIAGDLTLATAENNVALNPSISRTGTQPTFGRVLGRFGINPPTDGTGTNNHAIATMTMPGDIAVTSSASGVHGADFDNSGLTAWQTAVPTWDIKATKAEAGPSSPWYWDASAMRPRLWND